MNQEIANILGANTAVTLVANEQENNVLVTPLRDKQSGRPKTDLNGRPLGSIRLEQTTRMLNGTFLNASRRVAFIGGTIEELENIVVENNLKNGTKLPGKITILESLTPMWNGHEPKINPNTVEPVGVTVNEKFYPVYMQMRYTDDATTKDRLIRTPEDVIGWLAAQKVTENVTVVNEAASIPTA
jgi:hypothetical protein